MVPKSNQKSVGPVVSILVVALFAGALLFQGATADHEPADKGSAAASGVEILSTPVVEGSSSEVVSLLNTSLKTSKGTDLLLQVTLECSLWTDVTVMGNDESEAVATVKVWLEVDGAPVVVASETDPADEEPGKVVFCNRAYKVATTNVDDEDMQIETFFKTRAAHGFNWIQLDLESGVHTVELKGELSAEVTGTGMAKAGIGKRTLIIEPTKFANDLVL
ncbi:MAG: hypothetical protein KY455_06030 [Euryarchaeota archaeon]|nr:hypothetical protein [Euryarchaeota archaeon]